MAKSIVINGKAYDIPEMDFNAVCELSECGVDLMNPKTLDRSPMIAARAIAAWIMGTDKKTAGTEIQNHIVSGGDASEMFSNIFGAFSEEAENSGFFRALSKGTAEKTVELQDHKKKAK